MSQYRRSHSTPNASIRWRRRSSMTASLSSSVLSTSSRNATSAGDFTASRRRDECLANFAEQRLGRERLGEKLRARTALFVVDQCVVEIAGHHDDPKIGSKLPELGEKRRTALSRH